MESTTEGRFRVLPGRPDRSALTLLDLASYEPVAVEADGYEGELADRVATLRPGYAVAATLTWTDGTARFREVAVETPTLYEFVDGATNLFEAARDTWQEARREGEPIASRTTYSTDGEPNGVVYTFARQRGERDLFAEFRDGARPIEPLVERTGEGEGDDGPREVFVMRPAGREFVVVYVVLRKGSMLADTVRDTYDCPRPSEAED